VAFPDASVFLRFLGCTPERPGRAMSLASGGDLEGLTVCTAEIVGK